MSEIKPPPGRLERAEAILIGLAKVIAGVGLLIGAIYGVVTALQPFLPSSSPGPVATFTASPNQSNEEAVQNVYNLPEARGMRILADQGFVDIRVEKVCSNSVAAGRIRQLLLVDGTVLVDEGGSTGVEVADSERIRVKVSNGQSCP